MGMPMLGEIALATKYKLKGVENAAPGKVVTIDVVGKLGTDESKTIDKGTRTVTIRKPAMDIAAQVKVNLENTLLLSEEIEMNGSVVISISAPNHPAEDTTVTMKSKVSGKTEKQEPSTQP